MPDILSAQQTTTTPPQEPPPVPPAGSGTTPTESTTPSVNTSMLPKPKEVSTPNTDTLSIHADPTQQDKPELKPAAPATIHEEPPVEPAPGFTVPPTPKPKRKGPVGMILALVFLLLAAIPVGVYFVSQQNQQVTESRARAGSPCERAAGEATEAYCENGTSMQHTCIGGPCSGDASRICGEWGNPSPGGNACGASGGGGNPPGGGGNPGGSSIQGQSCSPNAAITCSNGRKHFCSNGTWSEPGEACQGSGTCNSTGYSCTGTQCYARNAMNATGQCGDVQVDPSLCGAAGCGGVTGGGSCSEYTFNVAAGRCNSADVNQCRTYSECCAPGKSRIIKATCLADGRERFDVVSSCNDALPAGVCGTATAPGPVDPQCPPGQHFWPPPSGDGQCHDISAPANPGGGTANCSPNGGCTGGSGQCIKRWTCTQAELTPQGFCLRNMAAAQFGTSYQAEANSTCKYIQVDVYNAQYCPNGMTTTTPHAGTIIYRPANPNGCSTGGTQPTNPPSSNPTHTTSPLASPTTAQTMCQSLLIYETNGTNITEGIRTGARKLSVGDTIVLATPKGQATKAHFRIQGITQYQDHDPAVSTATEYRIRITIPSTITQATGKFEVEVMLGGQWK